MSKNTKKTKQQKNAARTALNATNDPTLPGRMNARRRKLLDYAEQSASPAARMAARALLKASLASIGPEWDDFPRTAVDLSYLRNMRDQGLFDYGGWVMLAAISPRWRKLTIHEVWEQTVGAKGCQDPDWADAAIWLRKCDGSDRIVNRLAGDADGNGDAGMEGNPDLVAARIRAEHVRACQALSSVHTKLTGIGYHINAAGIEINIEWKGHGIDALERECLQVIERLDDVFALLRETNHELVASRGVVAAKAKQGVALAVAEAERDRLQKIITDAMRKVGGGDGEVKP